MKPRITKFIKFVYIHAKLYKKVHKENWKRPSKDQSWHVNFVLRFILPLPYKSGAITCIQMHLLINKFFSSLSCSLKSLHTLQTRANEAIHIPTEKCLCICNVTEVDLLSCNTEEFKPSVQKHLRVFCCYRNYSKKWKLQKNREFFCEPFTRHLPPYLKKGFNDYSISILDFSGQCMFSQLLEAAVCVCLTFLAHIPQDRACNTCRTI